MAETLNREVFVSMKWENANAMFLPPMPRMRLYTTTYAYASFLASLASWHYWRGDDVARLEQRIAESLGVPHAVAMPMARTGIYCLIKAIVGKKRKVILSPYTISDVVNMVICAGGIPVFADVERSTCNIDPTQVEGLIDDQTAAVMVTHFYGLTCRMSELRSLCDRSGVPLIEDAAQAFGAVVDGRPAGTIGDAAVYSFGLYKNVTSFLGGMVVTRSSLIAERVRAGMRDWPLTPAWRLFRKAVAAAITDFATNPVVFRALTYWIFRHAHLHHVESLNNKLKIDVDPRLKERVPDSYLTRMTPFQARLAYRQLDAVDELSRHRIGIARIYHEGLLDIDDLILPPFRDDFSHIYAYYPVQYADRDALVDFALRHYRDIALSHHRNCASMPCFEEYARLCPEAQAAADSLIYLPTYPGYSRNEALKNVAVVRRFFGKKP